MRLMPASTMSEADTLLAPTVVRWYATAARDLPWRRPDAGPWAVLVSEVMLQQTPVRRVLPTYTRWRARWPTPADLAAASAGEAVREWGGLGYPRRALHLHAVARIIVESYGGQVPADLDALLRLPGVGGYTARAVAAFGFGQRHAVVDTNARRVLTRVVLGRAHSRPSPAADLRLAERFLPKGPRPAATYAAALMELGALICTARRPRCGDCPLRRHCAWRAAGYPPQPQGPRQPYAGRTGRRAVDCSRSPALPKPAQPTQQRWPPPGQSGRSATALWPAWSPTGCSWSAPTAATSCPDRLRTSGRNLPRGGPNLEAAPRTSA
jgi:A/G-specific adenine glycosylase